MALMLLRHGATAETSAFGAKPTSAERRANDRYANSHRTPARRQLIVEDAPRRSLEIAGPDSANCLGADGSQSCYYPSAVLAKPENSLPSQTTPIGNHVGAGACGEQRVSRRRNPRNEVQRAEEERF